MDFFIINVDVFADAVDHFKAPLLTESIIFLSKKNNNQILLTTDFWMVHTLLTMPINVIFIKVEISNYIYSPVIYAYYQSVGHC